MENNKFEYELYQYPTSKNMFPIGDKPVKLDQLGFYICQEGYVDINLDNKNIRLTPNTICVVFPSSILGLCGYSDDFKGFGAKASILFIDELFIPNIGNYYSFISSNPVTTIDANRIEWLKNIVWAINAKLKQNQEQFTMLVVQNLLNSLSYEIISCYNIDQKLAKNTKSTRQDDIFRDFISILNRNHRKERGLAFYANELCLTTRYLSSVIKEKTGHPATFWIENTVISQAKNMLRNTTLSVIQISEELNFANASFFGQYFKKYAGVTPYDYRRGKE